MANLNTNTMAMIVKTYEHDGQMLNVSFTEAGFFNATAVAKTFGKQPRDWLTATTTQEYIDAIKARTLLEQNQLVIVKNGSPENGGGTWLHPKLGVPFARWCNVDFAVWADEQIEAIIRGPQQIDLASLSSQALRQLAITIEENSALKTRIQSMQPKEEFFDHVIGSTALWSMKDTAQMLRTGQKRLTDKLVEWQIFTKDRRPSQKYLDKDWFRTIPVLVKQGASMIPYSQPVVTGKGFTMLKSLMDAKVMSNSRELVKI